MKYNRTMIVFFSMSDPPEQPGKPVIKEIDRGYVSISWEPPENDGGAPITAYIVEKKDEDGDWEQVSVVFKN